MSGKNQITHGPPFCSITREKNPIPTGVLGTYRKSNKYRKTSNNPEKSLRGRTDIFCTRALYAHAHWCTNEYFFICFFFFYRVATSNNRFFDSRAHCLYPVTGSACNYVTSTTSTRRIYVRSIKNYSAAFVLFYYYLLVVTSRCTGGVVRGMNWGNDW